MSACQCASVAGTSLSPEGNITATTDVLKIVGGVVNTCPAVLQLAFAAALKSDLFCSLCSMLCSYIFILVRWKVLKIETSGRYLFTERKENQRNIGVKSHRGFALHLKIISSNEILYT